MNDPVNKPAHYTDGKIETIDFIEDKKLGFHLGNAVKYISRAGKKDPAKYVEDLRKAIWFIERAISKHAADKLDEKKPPVRSSNSFFDTFVVQSGPWKGFTKGKVLTDLAEKTGAARYRFDNDTLMWCDDSGQWVVAVATPADLADTKNVENAVIQSGPWKGYRKDVVLKEIGERYPKEAAFYSFNGDTLMYAYANSDEGAAITKPSTINPTDLGWKQLSLFKGEF